MQQYFVKIARSAAEKQAAFDLHRRTYLAEFKHDPITVSDVYLRNFQSDTVIVLDQHDRLLGTSSLTFAHNGLFPSEVLFGCDLRRSAWPLATGKLVEVGKMAKNHEIECPHPDLSFLALMMGISSYCQVHQLDGWVATVRTQLLRLMRAYGMTIAEIESGLMLPNGSNLSNDLGTYMHNRQILFVGSDTAQTALDFQRFQHLIRSGTILMGIGDFALV